MTQVTWVQDVNGNYEISSSEHLKQLMNQGSLYTDAGTPPSSYWGAGTNYIQTVDIDLLSDSTDIKPIGINGNIFEGNYDGAEYSISNYSYLDPNFNTSNSCEIFVGLFGYFAGDVLKNIRLSGLWIIEGFRFRIGFLGGLVSNQFGSVYNIECDFDVGSYIDSNSSVLNTRGGGVFGDITIQKFVGITLKGSVDLRYNTTNALYTGGICGSCTNHGETNLVRNLGTFPSGIQGQFAGGVFGQLESLSSSCSMILNAMTGNILGSNVQTQNVGGVIGKLDEQDDTCTTERVVNSMTGNISCDTDFSSIGGVIGYVQLENPCNFLLNYMTGNISYTSNSVKEGGLVGTLSNNATNLLSNSINAMNGSVGVGIGSAVQSFVTNTTVNTNFGLVFTSDTVSTGTPTGLLTNNEFTDLPYFDLVGTDVDGKSYDFEFVYANLSGNSSYSDYTHLVLHRGDINTPYEVSYGLSSTNTTVYLTYANTQTMTVFPQAGLNATSAVTIVIPSLIDSTARAVNIPIVITEVSGATSYQITYEGPTGGEVNAIEGVTALEHNVTGLLPETLYTIRLYADTGGGYALQEETVVETLPNVAANYDVSDFTTDGVISLSSLPVSTLTNIAHVMTEIFNTGDIVNIAVKGNLSTSFINLGDTLSIAEINGVLLPFEETTGAGQNVNVTLSDGTTTVAVDYDETVNSVTVDSVVYYPGDSFVMDGKKVTVIEFT